MIHFYKILRNFHLVVKTTGVNRFILSYGSWMQGYACFLKASTRVELKNLNRLTLQLSTNLWTKKVEEICGAARWVSIEAQAT